MPPVPQPLLNTPLVAMQSQKVGVMRTPLAVGLDKAMGDHLHFSSLLKCPLSVYYLTADQQKKFSKELQYEIYVVGLP